MTSHTVQAVATLLAAAVINQIDYSRQFDTRFRYERFHPRPANQHQFINYRPSPHPNYRSNISTEISLALTAVIYLSFCFWTESSYSPIDWAAFFSDFRRVCSMKLI